MDEDGGVDDTIGVEVEVLDPTVLEHPFEEVAREEFESALHETCEYWNLVRVLLHGVPIPGGGAPQIHLLLTEELAIDEGEEILGLQLLLFSIPYVTSLNLD
jgi:hypothetical protein